ncbi:MAG TPA: hypothetical protein VI755_00150 [Anaerolineales bacterium]|nr:hypothetical protein [Anaerolineales bacterium]
MTTTAKQLLGLFPLHLHPQLLPICRQLNPAISIGAQQGVSLDCLQSLRRRQPLPVPSGDAEQDDLRAQVGDPLGRVSGGVAALGQAS